MSLAFERFAPIASALPLEVPFHKSTASNPSGNCVDVGVLENGSVAVRHSGNPDGVALIFTPGEWDAFEAGVRNGEFSRSA